MQKALVRQLDTGRLTTFIDRAAKLHGVYTSVKAEYARLEKVKKRVEQAAALLDPKKRTRTLVELGAEGAYALAETLTKAGSVLPVVAVFKAYYSTHLKVLAACAQSMSDHGRAMASLRQLGQISATVQQDSPAQIRNFSAALQDQRRAARGEVAVLRVFRPAGYHPTGIMERVMAQLVTKASDPALAKAFPPRNAPDIRQMAHRVTVNADYQQAVDESLRDNRDLALHQLTEVMAAATVYRGLLWRALAISQAIDSEADAAADSRGMNVFQRLSASSVGQAKQFDELDGKVLDASSLRAIDTNWQALVNSWQQFAGRLMDFRG